MVFTMRKQFGETSIFSKYFGIGPLSFTVNTSTRALLQKNCIALSSVMIQKEIMNKVTNNNFTHLRKSVLLVFIALLLQIFLGILTVISGAYIVLASMHQIGSIFLITTSLILVFKNSKIS